MNKCVNKAIKINGFDVTDRGYFFVAINNDVELQFVAEGRNGGLYSKVVGYVDKKTGRVYKAQRYLYKYTSVVQGLSATLAEQDFLWDYITQEPFLSAKIKAMVKTDNARLKEGKKQLYVEYLNQHGIIL